MGAQQYLRLEVADFQATGKFAHQHLAANGSRLGAIAAVVYPYARVVADHVDLVGEVFEVARRQSTQMGALFIKHHLNLATGTAVDPSGRPVRFPLIKEGVLLLDRLEPAALQGRALGVLERILDGALAIRISYARWVATTP